MSCNSSHFQLSDIGGFSMESEAFISFHCVSNLLKVAVFAVYLGFYAFLTLFFALILIMDVWWDRSGATLRQRSYFSLFVGSMCAVIKFAMYIGGVYNRWRYLVYPIPILCVTWTGYEMARAWFQAAETMNSMGNSDEEKVLKETKIFRGLLSWMIIGYVIFYGIAPIASFEDPWVLNWFYAFAVSHQGLVAAIALVIMLIYGRKLQKELEEWKETGKTARSGGDKDVSILIIKVRILLIAIKINLAPTIFLFAAPIIWMGVSFTATTPGMQYSFYLEFFVNNFLILVAYFGVGSFVSNRSSFTGASFIKKSSLPDSANSGNPSSNRPSKEVQPNNVHANGVSEVGMENA